MISPYDYIYVEYLNGVKREYQLRSLGTVPLIIL